MRGKIVVSKYYIIFLTVQVLKFSMQKGREQAFQHIIVLNGGYVRIFLNASFGLFSTIVWIWLYSTSHSLYADQMFDIMSFCGRCYLTKSVCCFACIWLFAAYTLHTFCNIQFIKLSFHSKYTCIYIIIKNFIYIFQAFLIWPSLTVEQK